MNLDNPEYPDSHYGDPDGVKWSAMSHPLN
jgi:hypothetical protein